MHEGGFDVRCHAADKFIFIRPDDSKVMNKVPQITIDSCAESLLKQQNQQRGLMIDLDTAAPQWDGAHMGRDMAIDAMFSANGDSKSEWGDVSAETQETPSA